jgi:hypothetical protein
VFSGTPDGDLVSISSVVVVLLRAIAQDVNQLTWPVTSKGPNLIAVDPSFVVAAMVLQTLEEVNVRTARVVNLSMSVLRRKVQIMSYLYPPLPVLPISSR